MQSLNYLVVEDHAFQRAMLVQLLHGLGADAVHSAGNGREAMRVLRDPAARIDVVISDLMMPDVDGIELLPALRDASPPVALVLISADRNVLPAAEAIATAQSLTVLGVIEKPVTVAKLRPLLERHAADSRRPAGTD